ncbi:hypothetical protein JTB14_002304 [Gonioctena quinquepunctata]|nr:hypothetical protein JTB14_002304 [Gonioctena quinquepunctata]
MFTFEEMRNFLTQELEKCTKTLLDEISNMRVEVQNLKESNIDIVRLLSDNLPEFQKSVAVPANIDQSSNIDMMKLFRQEKTACSNMSASDININNSFESDSSADTIINIKTAECRKNVNSVSIPKHRNKNKSGQCTINGTKNNAKKHSTVIVGTGSSQQLIPSSIENVQGDSEESKSSSEAFEGAPRRLWLYVGIIDYALALFCPVNSKTIHQKNSSSKEWVKKEIIEMGRRLKNLYWLKVNTHEQTDLNEEYKCFKKEYERKVSYTKHTHYQSRINDKQNITEKQKYFWKLVREKNGKTKNNQPPDIVINNKLTTNKTVIADELCKHFATSPRIALDLHILNSTSEVCTLAKTSILAAAYFPPKSPVAAYVAFNEEVDRICEEFPTAHLCIFGDFNLPHSAWSVNNLSSTAIPLFNSSSAESESLDILSNMCAFHNLFQSNHVTNHVNSILDLIFLQTLGSLVEKADFNIVQPDLTTLNLYH